MATPIIVRPTEQSPIIINPIGGNVGIAKMIDERVDAALKQVLGQKFSLGINGKKGRQIITLIGSIEQSETNGAYTEGNTLVVRGGTMNGNTLNISYAILDGSTLYL
jgi:hypothetical protein